MNDGTVWSYMIIVGLVPIKYKLGIWIDKTIGHLRHLWNRLYRHTILCFVLNESRPDRGTGLAKCAKTCSIMCRNVRAPIPLQSSTWGKCSSRTPNPFLCATICSLSLSFTLYRRLSSLCCSWRLWTNRNLHCELSLWACVCVKYLCVCLRVWGLLACLFHNRNSKY